MYKENDYIVFKKDVCKILQIKKNLHNNKDYYILVPVEDESLTMEIPTEMSDKCIRPLISKKELKNFLTKIPSIEIIDCPDNFLENEYKALLSSCSHEDLIKIIKTTYKRNQGRLENGKKASGKDTKYFDLAEKYLYTEFSIVLGMSIEETKKFIIDEVKKQE